MLDLDTLERCAFGSKLLTEIDKAISKRNKICESAPFDIRISHLAAALHMDSSTLRRHCHKHLDTSPKQILDTYRVNKAKEQLVNGKKPSKIFASLGFREHKTFSTLFKRYEGLSPSEFFHDGSAHCRIEQEIPNEPN